MSSKKVMMINATDPEEIRIATLIDGTLFDYDVEFVHNEKIKGNIYKAKVIRVDQSLQAAFIHYGGQKNGFLPLGELPRDMVSGDGRRGRIQDLLHRDQEIMVQAVREELGSKGAMMTAQISLAGRYLVVTPGNPVNGISRKIEGTEERRHFKQLIDSLEIPDNIGVIVRTASLGVTKEDFQRDLEYLLDSYKEVQHRYKHRMGAGLVWQEDDVVVRTLRDAFTPDVEEVSIDDLDTFHTAQSFVKRTMPQYLPVLKHYIGKKPIFSRHQTEEQIDRVYARKVNLPSGGALVLDQTEALVAIDVNSGKTSGDNQEDTAYKTNLEAAEEVARQLRLRDLAGLVAIDFIDMRKESHIKAVQDRLVEHLKQDKARMEVGKINRFGVLVMTRQRIRPSLQHVNHEGCPTCQGTGKVKTIEALVLSVLRRIKGIAARGDVKELRIKLHPDIASSVLNGKRRDIAELEERNDIHVLVIADWSTPYGEMAAEIERHEEDREKPADKPAKPAPRERHKDEETVVLGGDSPISFDKALNEDRPAEKPKDFKYDRRDAQKAALDERERLRALFESAKPEDDESEEEGDEGAEGSEEETKGDGTKRKRRRRRRRGGERDRGEGTEGAATEHAAAPAEPQIAAAKPAPRPKAEPTPAPEPPKLTGDVLASLLTPAARPKKLGAAKPVEVAEPAPKPAPKTKKAAKAEPVEAVAKPKKAVKAESVEAPAAKAKKAPAKAKAAEAATAPKAKKPAAKAKVKA
ncbi:MAG: Rne/Rng family ribonuclease [Acidobacteria bacterium]|nr:Rne/Rng family ribonuclease [Acidobacteriota bacterium]